MLYFVTMVVSCFPAYLWSLWIRKLAAQRFWVDQLVRPMGRLAPGAFRQADLVLGLAGEWAWYLRLQGQA